MTTNIKRAVDKLMSELSDEGVVYPRSYCESRVQLLIDIISKKRLMRQKITAVGLYQIWESALARILADDELSDDMRYYYTTTLSEFQSIRIRLNARSESQLRCYMIDHSTLSARGLELYLQQASYEALLYENPRSLMYPL